MQYQVFVQSLSDATFLASIVGIPNCTAEGATKEAAIAGAKTVLKQQLQTGEMLTINLDASTILPEYDPWIKHMGIFADDPTFDDFMAEIAAYRQQIDTQTGEV